MIPRKLTNQYQEQLNRFLQTGRLPGAERRPGTVPGEVRSAGRLRRPGTPVDQLVSGRRAPSLFFETPPREDRGPGMLPAEASPVAQAVTANISIVVNGNVDDPDELARKLAPMLRDELRRIEPRFSRAGNKTQV